MALPFAASCSLGLLVLLAGNVAWAQNVSVFRGITASASAPVPPPAGTPSASAARADFLSRVPVSSAYDFNRLPSLSDIPEHLDYPIFGKVTTAFATPSYLAWHSSDVCPGSGYCWYPPESYAGGAMLAVPSYYWSFKFAQPVTAFGMFLGDVADWDLLGETTFIELFRGGVRVGDRMRGTNVESALTNNWWMFYFGVISSVPFDEVRVDDNSDGAFFMDIRIGLDDTVVPEPSTLCLTALAVPLLIASRRRRGSAPSA